MKIAVMSFAHGHAEGYIRLLQAMDDVEVRAADPGPHPEGERRGADLAADLGVGYVDDYDELLGWGPDAVIVTSENARHREHVELAAAAGADILCEKPLATTWADGLAMRDAVSRHGVRLMMAFPVRFASTFARLRREHAAGLLGRVFAVRGANNGMLPTGRSWFADPALAGGGALMDHVVHLADLVDALLGAAPERVTAVTNRTLHAERARAETAGLVTIEYGDGTIAAVDCSWSEADTAAAWGDVTLSVAGTAGNVDVDFFGPAVRGLDARTGTPIVRRYGQDFDKAMLAAFVDSVRTGSPMDPSIEVGLRTLSIVVAAQESARTRRSVEVPRVTPAGRPG
ncbi:MAG TPA: Gfo/Idh/MocA family oxidoreductase [Propionibacteriaceae bacterium]|nr:Gfo/Idh/MocA family oxidoreductase [Propionibacteriaceae bacterium]